MKKMKTLKLPGMSEVYKVYDEEAIRTINGAKPDEEGNVDIEISEGLPIDAAPYQQLVTDISGITKWEEKPFYENGFVSVKLSSENTKAEIQSSGQTLYIANGHSIDSPEVLRAFAIVADNIWLHLMDQWTWEFYWDGIPFITPKRRLPVALRPWDGVTLHILQHGNAARVELAFEDGAEHTFEFKTFEYTIKPLNEEFIPTTVPVIPTAQPGQTAVVKTVDENGKPTEWKTVYFENNCYECIIPVEHSLDDADSVTDYDYTSRASEGVFASKLVKLTDENLNKLKTAFVTDCCLILGDIKFIYDSTQSNNDARVYCAAPRLIIQDGLFSETDDLTKVVQCMRIKVFLTGDNAGKMILAQTDIQL